MSETALSTEMIFLAYLPENGIVTVLIWSKVSALPVLKSSGQGLQEADLQAGLFWWQISG
jgi:hypothetical protein